MLFPKQKLKKHLDFCDISQLCWSGSLVVPFDIVGLFLFIFMPTVPAEALRVWLISRCKASLIGQHTHTWS